MYEQLNLILEHHLTALTKEPQYDEMFATETLEEKERKTAFLKRMFVKCLRNLNDYLDQKEQKQSSGQKIHFTCPSCARKLHISLDMVGKKGCCPNCKHPIVVQVD